MENAVYLVTGGTGSFGKSFIQDLLLNHNPKQVRVISRDEYKQHVLKQEIRDPRLECFIGDVRDYELLLKAMDGVDIVIHAAALKRIEVCEKCPQEAIKTNVQGTVNVANAALACGVKNAVMISTDKAASPTNLYGATKMVAEKAWNQCNVYRGSNKPTKFSVVRYGNVVGSRGSVIPLFRQQAKDGVITVTNPRMTRFFIRLREAVDLVHAAIEFQQGGEVFLPQLKAMNIERLAKAIGPKAHIVYCAERPSEKLHEVLFSPEEFKRLKSLDGYCIIEPEYTTWPYIPSGEAFEGEFFSSETAPQYTESELKELLNAE